MDHKEALFFIGKCLTIAHESDNKKYIVDTIQSNEVDWDNVVQVSTAHFVFPALYVNLKRENLLTYLPKDLVAYMKHITDLNRERNQEIVRQAKHIHQLLQDNHITPIFTKGTGFLLQGLYHDPAERMVGDIDLLVSKTDFEKTVQLLKSHSYGTDDRIDRSFVMRHYSRLTSSDYIAAIEVHHSLTRNPFHKHFNYNIVHGQVQLHENISVLSWKDQVLMTALNKQVNDQGMHTKNFALRNSYDLYLLAQKINPLQAIQDFGHYVDILHQFLASSRFLLGTERIPTSPNKSSEKFISEQLHHLDYPEVAQKVKKKWDRKLMRQTQLKMLTKLLYDKRAWQFFYARVFRSNS